MLFVGVLASLVWLVRSEVDNSTSVHDNRINWAGACPSWAQSRHHDAELTVIEDECSVRGNKLPKAFRTTKDDVRSRYYQGDFLFAMPDITGLDELPMSGSAQFCTGDESSDGETLARALKLKNRQVAFVDTRGEAHGYVDPQGLSISWFCPKNWARANLKRDLLDVDEVLRLDGIERDGVLKLSKAIGHSRTVKSSSKIPISRAFSEEDYIRRHGFSYVRLHVDAHKKPRVEDEIAFEDLVLGLTKDSWLHVHCDDGGDRTTMFMVIADFMMNSKRVSFADILLRHHVLGGVNLLKTRFGPGMEWKENEAEKRLEFLRGIYEYYRHSEYGKRRRI